MELIVINVGYDLGVISQNVFTMLVIMAIVSTIVTTPGLRRWLPRLGLPLPAKQH
jgi:Kef-type K+ transport system membrane component KefB